MAKPKVNKKEFNKYKKHGYSLDEIKAYHQALHKAYLSVLATPTDAVLAPLRGAEPLAKIIRQFATYDRKSSFLPRFYYPRTGQIQFGGAGVHEKIDPTYAPSLSVKKQKQAISRIIDKIIKTHKSNKRSITITVLDEVHSGGSLVQTIELLEDIIAEKRSKAKIGITIISIAEKGKNRSPAYRRLKSIRKVKEFVVPKVFTLDSKKFLYPLLTTKVRRWPFERFPKLGLTRIALRGRQEMFADIDALHQNGSKNAKARERLHRLVKKRPR